MTATPLTSTLTSGGKRIVCPPMMEKDLISTSLEVKSA
ncbi:Uncharacterised protein [Mycobacteroides abscessus subsp. abscessus]|nr:Uncharacterised protein [Mycobacteroides abscessus subsp. abscessus]